MNTPLSRRVRLAQGIVALGTGCLLTLMLFFNSELARQGGPLFASWTAHGTGTVAGLALLLMLSKGKFKPNVARAASAPVWAYLGGFTGAVNVMISSMAVNMGLALSGTQAVALSGQMVFSLAADRWGVFGLPKRRLVWRDLLPIALIVGGSLVIILFGTGERP